MTDLREASFVYRAIRTPFGRYGGALGTARPDAAMIAARAVECGDHDVVFTGGVESMSRAPWVLPKPTKPFPVGNDTLVSTTLGWRLVNERMPAEWTVSLGAANEQLLQQTFGIDRARQDAFAVRSLAVVLKNTAG